MVGLHLQKRWTVVVWCVDLTLAAGSDGHGELAIAFPSMPHLRPGIAEATIEEASHTLTLQNKVLAARWTLKGPDLERRLCPISFHAKLEGPALTLPQDAFYARFRGSPHVLRSSDMIAAGDFRLTRLRPRANASSSPASLNYGGWRAEVKLQHATQGFEATWSVELRDDANYLRVLVKLCNTNSEGASIELNELVLLDTSVAPQRSGTVGGQLAGSVGTVGDVFFVGYEHPQANNGDGASPEHDTGEFVERFVAGARRGTMSVDIDVTLLVLSGHPLHVYLDNWHNDAQVKILWADLLACHEGQATRRSTVVSSDRGHTGVASRHQTRGNIFVLVPPPERGSHVGENFVVRFWLEVDGEYTAEWVIGATRKGLDGRIYCSLRQNRTVAAGSVYQGSLVFGTAPHGQLRRAFLYYLERERSHRTRPMLHYNSWYDIGTGQQYGATEALATLELISAQLSSRGVPLDAFLLDDGWDDPGQGPWEPHESFAKEALDALTRRAEQLGIGLGMWFSPWGGYHEPRQRRLDAARRAGLPVREETAVQVSAVRRTGSSICSEEIPCDIGEGDCRSDKDCLSGLQCFQTEHGVSPPGVDASRITDPTASFCFDPNVHSAFLGLGEPQYYTFFRNVLVRWLRAGAQLLKLDGLGNPAGRRFTSADDFDAATSLLGELRRVRPSVFINLSTGTWPSPFWLLSADTIWRQGHDHYFQGGPEDGPARERWITYRDAMVYEHVVEKSPLFPLNSLMVHGIIFAKDAWDLNKPEGSGEGTSAVPFRHEVRSAFGSGTMLQELYLTPKLLSHEQWDDLADAARWARGATQTLADVHWWGGNPARRQAYGWAAWRDVDDDSPHSSTHAVVTLRNPTNAPQTIHLDASTLFELPAHARRFMELRSPFRDQVPQRLLLQPGKEVQLELQAFDVLVFDSGSTENVVPVAAPDSSRGTPWAVAVVTFVLVVFPVVLWHRQGTAAYPSPQGKTPLTIEELRSRRLAALDHHSKEGPSRTCLS